MTKTIKFLGLITIVGLSLMLMNNGTKDSIPVKEIRSNSSNKNVSEHYEIKALKLPKEISFAGEKIPLHKADIRERLDKELLVNTYWQSKGILLLKRAHKFLPIIEPILKKEGIPDDFKYLAIAESGLENLVSPARASGFWQFLKGTAKEFGLEVNKNVDERYNLEKATYAVTKYLKRSKRKFGSWALATAAYNAGNGRISKRLAEQKVDNYYDLLLNMETSRYVFRIIALKEILSNPVKYGFNCDQEDLYTYPKIKKIKVNYKIPNLADFAKKHNITYKELKLVNPWLRETKLDNKTNKTYIFKIPVK